MPIPGYIASNSPEGDGVPLNRHWLMTPTASSACGGSLSPQARREAGFLLCGPTGSNMVDDETQWQPICGLRSAAPLAAWPDTGARASPHGSSARRFPGAPSSSMSSAASSSASSPRSPARTAASSPSTLTRQFVMIGILGGYTTFSVLQPADAQPRPGRRMAAGRRQHRAFRRRLPGRRVAGLRARSLRSTPLKWI